MTDFFYILYYPKELYNKRNFKACEARETAVYYDVNEDFEGKRNAEITLFDNSYCINSFSSQ